MLGALNLGFFGFFLKTLIDFSTIETLLGAVLANLPNLLISEGFLAKCWDVGEAPKWNLGLRPACLRRLFDENKVRR